MWQDSRPIGRILLPVDFTRRSIEAAKCAVTLAETFGSHVTVLHVVRPGAGGLTSAQQGVQQRVAEILRDVHSRTEFLNGDPAKRVVEHARQESTGLIVMWTRGRRSWMGLRNNSVTARVIRHARCPVWASIEGVAEPGRHRKVLCALALAPRSSEVLRWASRVAKHFQSGLAIMHSNPGFAEAPGAWYYAQLHRARRAWAFEDIATLQRAAGTSADVWLGAAAPERAVTAIARLIRADLLVIGRSPSLWSPRRPRIRPYDLVCDAPCPVAIS